MAVYNRNADHPDRQASYWLDYYVGAERVREPGCGANKRAAERLLEQRMREIAAGTWKHPRDRAPLLTAEYAERHIAERKAAAELAPSPRAVQNVHDQAQRLRNYVLPKIGQMPLRDVATPNTREIIADLIREARLAPRTINHVYDAMRTMFAAALAAELIERSPCTLTTKGINGGLPKKRDKNPAWRSSATFTHGELLDLFTDERIPIDRRTFYALLFFCGNRFGEAAGRRLRDYDRHAQPLGRIVCATQYEDQPLKGEAPPRDIPVHPFLAWMLEQWLSEGFELVMLRAPKPDDWLVPSRLGRVRSNKHMGHKLEQDLERIGLRRRTPHNLRAAFISLAQEDGGSRDILELVTHKGNRDVWSGYTRHPWRVLCEHVAMLKMPIPPDPSRSHNRSHFAEIGSLLRDSQRDGRDLKQSPRAGTRGKLPESGDIALARYAEILGIPLAPRQPVTSGVTVQLARDLAHAHELAGQHGGRHAARLQAALAVAVGALPSAGGDALAALGAFVRGAGAGLEPEERALLAKAMEVLGDAAQRDVKPEERSA